MDSKLDNRQYPDIQTLVRETPELTLFKPYSDEKAVEQLLAKKPKENIGAILIPIGNRKDDTYQYGPVPGLSFIFLIFKNIYRYIYFYKFLNK